MTPEWVTLALPNLIVSIEMERKIFHTEVFNIGQMKTEGNFENLFLVGW